MGCRPIQFLRRSEVGRRLKADPATRAIKILGVTGYPNMIPALMKAGADACITKPVDLHRMQQELERLGAFRGA